MMKIFTLIWLSFVAFSPKLMADNSPPVNLYPYTAGCPLAAKDLLIVDPAVKLTGTTLTLEAVAFDKLDCAISTPKFISTGSGTLVVQIHLKRTYIGDVPANGSLESRPYANVEFERDYVGGAEGVVTDQPLTFGIIQSAMIDDVMAKIGGTSYVVAYDNSDQVYTTSFDETVGFQNGSVRICNVFQGGGFIIDSITLTIVQ